MLEDIIFYVLLLFVATPLTVLAIFIHHYNHYVSLLRYREEELVRDAITSSFNRAVSYAVRTLALKYAEEYFAGMRDKVIDNIVNAFEKAFEVLEGRPGWRLKSLSQRRKEFRDYIRKKAEDIRRYLDEAMAELARQAMAEDEVIDVFQELSALGKGIPKSMEKELREIYRKGHHVAMLKSELNSIKSHLAIITTVMIMLVIMWLILKPEVILGSVIILLCSTLILIIYYFVHAEKVLRKVSDTLHVSYEGPWRQIIQTLTLKKSIKSDKE